VATNVQLKGNSPGDPWFVIEGKPEEITQVLLEVFPSLGPVDGPEQFPSLVAKARALWAAQVTAGETLGAREVESQYTAPPPAAPPAPAPASPWGQSRSAPVGSAPASQSSAPLDPFGKPMVWRQGISKSTGKDYKGWFADYPKGQTPNGQDIPPMFVR
jgi:hypothetical protein